MQTYIHIRLLQRTGKKMITAIENLNELGCDLDKLLTHCRKTFHCNGYLKDEVIVLTGDQRILVRDFLINEEIAKKEDIRIHGA